MRGADNGIEVIVLVAYGLANARKVCESVRSGGRFAGYHFIEFMACKGDCIGGGGQLIPTNLEIRRARTEAVNRDDRQHPLPIRYLVALAVARKLTLKVELTRIAG